MAQLISEPIAPMAGTFNAGAMGRGEPGLPSAFTWRGQSCKIVQVLKRWKESSREGGTQHGQLYLRRHYCHVEMEDGARWTIYFTRQTPKTGNVKNRWFLYTIE